MTGYPIGDRLKANKKMDKNKLCELKKAQWDGRGLGISTVEEPKLSFACNFISY